MNLMDDETRDKLGGKFVKVVSIFQEKFGYPCPLQGFPTGLASGWRTHVKGYPYNQKLILKEKIHGWHEPAHDEPQKNK